MLCTASILNLCCISLDRYLAITRPLTYSRQRSPKLARTMIAIVWIASILISCPPVFGWRDRQRQPNTCYLNKLLSYRIYSSMGSFFLPCFVMIFVYLRIFKVIHDREKYLTNNNSSNTTTFSLPEIKIRGEQRKLLARVNASSKSTFAKAKKTTKNSKEVASSLSSSSERASRASKSAKSNKSNERATSKESLKKKAVEPSTLDASNCTNKTKVAVTVVARNQSPSVECDHEVAYANSSEPIQTDKLNAMPIKERENVNADLNDSKNESNVINCKHSKMDKRSESIANEKNVKDTNENSEILKENKLEKDRSKEKRSSCASQKQSTFKREHTDSLVANISKTATTRDSLFCSDDDCFCIKKSKSKNTRRLKSQQLGSSESLGDASSKANKAVKSLIETKENSLDSKKCNSPFTPRSSPSPTPSNQRSLSIACEKEVKCHEKKALRLFNCCSSEGEINESKKSRRFKFENSTASKLNNTESKIKNKYKTDVLRMSTSKGDTSSSSSSLSSLTVKTFKKQYQLQQQQHSAYKAHELSNSNVEQLKRNSKMTIKASRPANLHVLNKRLSNQSKNKKQTINRGYISRLRIAFRTFQHRRLRRPSSKSVCSSNVTQTTMAATPAIQANTSSTPINESKKNSLFYKYTTPIKTTSSTYCFNNGSNTVSALNHVSALNKTMPNDLVALKLATNSSAIDLNKIPFTIDESVKKNRQRYFSHYYNSYMQQCNDEQHVFDKQK
jgi:hypothetical protein